MKNYKKVQKICKIALVICGLSVISLAATHREIADKQFFAMGTIFEITVQDKNPVLPLEAAKAEILRIESLMDSALASSDISKINRNAGKQAVAVSTEVMELLQLIKENFTAVNGAFDPSIAPIVELWGFDNSENQPHLPTAAAIAAKLPYVDFSAIIIDEEHQTVYLPKSDMQLDLGGIAKGYAVDRVCRILEQRGVKSALINGGTSSIRVIGKKSFFADWNLGIGHPRKNNLLLGTATLPNNRAIGTSADNQNFFIENGIRYSHLLDPQSGYSVQDKMSVTVLAPTAAEADLFSTACFVLDEQQLQQLSLSRPDLEIIVCFSDGQVKIFNQDRFKAE